MSAGLSLPQQCSTCLACKSFRLGASFVQTGRKEKGEKKKKTLWRDPPSGEVRLDNITLYYREPVWVILKWEKREKKKLTAFDNKGPCVQTGGGTPFRWVPGNTGFARNRRRFTGAHLLFFFVHSGVNWRALHFVIKIFNTPAAVRYGEWRRWGRWLWLL